MSDEIDNPDEIAEDTVEDVRRPKNKFIAFGERVWSHIWFVILLSSVLIGAYVFYSFVQSGAIALDVTISADVNLGLPLTILSLAIVAFIVIYTWSRYIYIVGEENAEGVMAKILRGISIAMDNYSRDDVRRLREQDEEE